MKMSISSHRWTILLTLPFMISLAVAMTGSDFEAGNEGLISRELLSVTGTSVEPLWRPRISSMFKGVNLKRCEKKTSPPKNGSKCSKESKTCFFGTQDCDGYGAHPQTMCYCDGKSGSQTWNCTVEKCPVFPPPSSGCTADGKADLSGNDPLCPISSPLSDGAATCVQGLFGKQCSYGSEKCCGRCSANLVSVCDSTGQWASMFTDACMFPQCSTTQWPGVAGKTCVEVRTEIFKVYPGMTVLCLKPTDPMPTDDSFDRYIVMTDANGLAIKVVFNKNVPCPPVSPVTTGTLSCPGSGQQCAYNYTDDTGCQTSDSCTCLFNSWNCESESKCTPKTSPNPVVKDVITVVCPEVSPVTSNITACEDPSKQLCTYKYGSTIPGGVCTNNDDCTCVSGKWECLSSIGCVDDSPPFIVVDPVNATAIPCPKTSPAASNTTTCDDPSQQQCSYQYGSTIPGGICQNNDDCTCRNGAWDCVRQIGCVDDNPPFIVEDPMPPPLIQSGLCPEISPVTSNVTVCEDPSKQVCMYEYGSTIPGGVCTNRDDCTCVSGKWECLSSIGCVDDSPPFVVVDPVNASAIPCPEVSPITSNATVCEGQDHCIFAYDSTIPGGICKSNDDCTCVNNTWSCLSSISCVDNNPPVVQPVP